MLAARQQAQLAAALHWWHLLAQDLHHHRVLLASFRARRMRREGYAVLQEWREWAHERAQERRAIVCHWNRLLVTVRIGNWLCNQHSGLAHDVVTAKDSGRWLRVLGCCAIGAGCWSR